MIPVKPGFFIFKEIFKTRLPGMVFLALISNMAIYQTNSFPASWVGNWKGELLWYKAGSRTTKSEYGVEDSPADSGTNFTWHIIYGSPSDDSRPYKMRKKN